MTIVENTFDGSQKIFWLLSKDFRSYPLVLFKISFSPFATALLSFCIIRIPIPFINAELVFIIKRVNQDTNVRIDAADLASHTWSSYQAGFSAYIKIIEDYIVNNPKLVSLNKTQWKQDYSGIADEAEILATRIDGTDSLLAEIGRDAMGFVRLVLENSYFFDPEVVELQHKDIRGAYLANQK